MEPIYSEGFAVRFYKTDGTEWVANFQTRLDRLKKNYPNLKKPQNLFGSSCGTCYIMNPNETKPTKFLELAIQTFFKAQVKTDLFCKTKPT